MAARPMRCFCRPRSSARTHRSVFWLGARRRVSEQYITGEGIGPLIIGYHAVWGFRGIEVSHTRLRVRALDEPVSSLAWPPSECRVTAPLSQPHAGACSHACVPCAAAVRRRFGCCFPRGSADFGLAKIVRRRGGRLSQRYEMTGETGAVKS